MMPAPVMGASATDAGWVDGAAGLEAAGMAGGDVEVGTPDLGSGISAGACAVEFAAAKPVALMARNSASVAPRAKRRGFGVDMDFGTPVTLGKDATTGRITAGYGGLDRHNRPVTLN